MRYFLWFMALPMVFGLVTSSFQFVVMNGPLVLGAGVTVVVCVAALAGFGSVLALLRARNGHRRHTAWPVLGTRLDALVWTMLPTAVLGTIAWPDLALLRDRRWGAFGAVGVPVLAPALTLLLPFLGLLLWQWLPAEPVRAGKARTRFLAGPSVVSAVSEAPWRGAAGGAVRDEKRTPGGLLLALPPRQWRREPLSLPENARPARRTSRRVRWSGRIVVGLAALLALAAGLAAPADPRVQWYMMGDVRSAFLADGVAYVTYGEDDSLTLSARNAVTGQENWRVPLPATQAAEEHGAADTPKPEPHGKTPGQDTVYVGDLAVSALATRDGSVRWTYPAPEATPEIRFGRPLVAGTQVLVTATDGTLRALDAKTGKLRWKKQWGADAYGEGRSYPLSDPPSFLVDHGRAYLAQHGRVEVYGAASGRHIRKIDVPGGDTYGTVRIAVSAEDVYAASGSTLSAFADRTGKRLWSVPFEGDYAKVRSLTVSGDFLFVQDEYHLRRLDAHSGDSLWAEDVRGESMPVVSGDRVIVGYEQQITCLLVSSGKSCGITSAAGMDETLLTPDGSIMLVDERNFVEVFSADLSPRDEWNARQLLRSWGATI
ncbi:PQQ-binding-like beta-propeller repeat protein [Streptomyces sp. NPDC001443]